MIEEESGESSYYDDEEDPEASNTKDKDSDGGSVKGKF